VLSPSQSVLRPFLYQIKLSLCLRHNDRDKQLSRRAFNTGTNDNLGFSAFTRNIGAHFAQAWEKSFHSTIVHEFGPEFMTDLILVLLRPVLPPFEL
jgi:hypothetical protein